MKIQEGIATAVLKIHTLKQTDIRTSFTKMCDLYKDRDILGCEIGVYEGENARYMLLTNQRLTLHLVDGWNNVVVYTGGPSQGEEFCKLLRGVALVNVGVFENRAFITEKNSLDAVKSYPDEYFDYIYIDGDHDYEPALKDMIAWWPKVKKGGMLAGHDVAMKEVSDALHKFVKDNNITNYDTDKSNNEGRSDWWIYK